MSETAITHYRLVDPQTKEAILDLKSKTPAEAAKKAASRGYTDIWLHGKSGRAVHHKLHHFQGQKVKIPEEERSEWMQQHGMHHKPMVHKIGTVSVDEFYSGDKASYMHDIDDQYSYADEDVMVDSDEEESFADDSFADDDDQQESYSDDDSYAEEDQEAYSDDEDDSSSSYSAENDLLDLDYLNVSSD